MDCELAGGELVSCRLVGCKVVGCEFVGCKVVGCELVGCAHIKFREVIWNVGPPTNSSLTLTECGRYQLYVTGHLRTIRYWCILYLMDHDRYAKKC